MQAIEYDPERTSVWASRPSVVEVVNGGETDYFPANPSDLITPAVIAAAHRERAGQLSSVQSALAIMAVMR